MNLRSKDAIETSKQDNIIMNNILIAEFMGLRINHYGDYNIDKNIMGFDMIVCSPADTKFLTCVMGLRTVFASCEVAFGYKIKL